MKNAILLLLLSLIMLACGSQNQKTQEKEEEIIENIDESQLETIEIAVIGMTCGGCERTVQAAVGELPGVQSVKASHSDSTAIVKFNPAKSNYEAMKAAIIAKGYQVEDYSLMEKSPESGQIPHHD